ncbi:hypothetical protein GRX01_15370 [Halobaculum sp. WSA2]|uniref:Uncharacterized protein n=1 Tax=Halobaculum saliterrae TaxID=2073113 RepID=A0A6B0T1Q4_9EURY|nr:hypothetical protein [Halobaculum saliterrae]MXR42713.1 hypothetical protein [Halobaculum saliterrae]
MSDPVSGLLGAVLLRTILVGAVLVVMRFLAEGIYQPALALGGVLAVFAYMRITDAALLE